MTALERWAAIQAHLEVPGNKIMTVSALRPVIYDKRHADMFRVSGDSLYVRRGRHWDCLDFTPIRFGQTKEAA